MPYLEAVSSGFFTRVWVSILCQLGHLFYLFSSILRFDTQREIFILDWYYLDRVFYKIFELNGIYQKEEKPVEIFGKTKKQPKKTLP